MKPIIYFLVGLLMATAVMATVSYTDLSLQSVQLRSTDINITIDITTILNASGLTINNESLDFVNVSYSSPLQIRTFSESLSYNITLTNSALVQSDLPYISFSTTARKQITSNLAGYQSGTMWMKVDNCTTQTLTFEPSTGNYQTLVPSSCDELAKLARLDFNNLTSGINNFYVDDTIATNCSTGNMTMMFSIFGEDTPTESMYADAEVEFFYWRASDPTFKRNFTLTYTNITTGGICLTNNITSIQADLYIKHTVTGGYSHRYIFKNTSLSVAAPQNISLYNFDDTTGISTLRVTSRDYNTYDYYPRVIAALQRQYVGEGVWRTVQMDESGDYGLMVFHIEEQAVDYRLVFMDEYNHILMQTSTMKFSCTATVCDLTFRLTPYSGSGAGSSLAVSYGYTSGGNISATWSDPTSTSTIRTLVTKATPGGTQTLCDVTQTGSAGVAQCSMVGQTGTVMLQVQQDGTSVITTWVGLNSTSLGAIVGPKEGGFWSAGIIITCAMFGIFSPVGAIIATVIGLIFIYMLGLSTALTLPAMIVFVALGIFIGIKIKR